MKQGFTLMEVLVVVLIISILTVVALPHYQKAVEKSIMAEGKQTAAALRDAIQVFYDTYNRWPSQEDIDALDINLPSEGLSPNHRPVTKHFSLVLKSSGGPLITLQRLPEFQKYYIAVNADDLEIVCVYYSTATKYEKKLCDVPR